MPSEPDWGASGFQSIRDGLEMSDSLGLGSGSFGRDWSGYAIAYAFPCDCYLMRLWTGC